MAVSDVQIAKLALQHIGDRYDITSLDEATPEAEQINLVFNDVRDALLREHPWNFAKRYYTPSALIGTPPAGWEFMYSYPPTGLKITKIVHPLDPRGEKLEPLQFAIARNDDDIKVIMTNEQDPEFEYIKRVTVATEYDAMFDMALSWRLAEHVAMSLTGDGAIVDAMRANAQRYVGMAKMDDANEGTGTLQTREPTWMLARN
tara:strand:- start:418 stop:1026 length:609 start_codon:yes stop_codon:yes gene_type:complete